jgi:competence protein ComEC
MNYNILKSFVLFFVSINLIFCTELSFLLPEEYKTSYKDLDITFLNVGQGDSIFIIFPNKKTMLVDAGGSPYWMGENAWDPGKEVVVPFVKSVGINKIDYIIVSHPHGDHFGGMFSVLNLLDIGEFIDNGYTEGDPNYVDLLAIVDKKELPYEQIKEGDKFDIDKDITIEVFFPPKKGFPFEGTNNSSIVFKIVYKKFSVLLTGDIEFEVEQYLCSKYKNKLRSVVLKVPHHGSRTSSTEKFIKTVSPEIAIISCGKNNMFGHPHNEVVTRYKKLKIDLYRTDIDGNIKILTNGDEYTVIPKYISEKF